MLQGVSCDLVEAVNECQTLIRVFENERNDIAVFNCLYDEAVELAEHFEIVPSKPRTTGRQRNRANPAVVGIQDYWRFTLYIQFLDHLLNELRDRFVNSEERFLAQMLLPNNLKTLNQDHQIRIFRAYESDLQSEDQFLLEIKRWVARWDIYPSKKPDQLCATFEMTPKELYPNIFCILQILLTMPPSTTTAAERSFSALKRVKTYLRSTMGQDRLSSLALLHVHSDFDIDTKEVVDTFNNDRQRKMLLS
ncbi:unnamed protein product [Mytilus coruscus]|uniref:HAT C-terminal dimerisation domain-containing protein n=1 Tax=Mytilus coruscus TaxID=42192 RepID=A0A6J8AQI3_MYTCO|nr:unnamed protein product [Mytilus coruscus]